MGLVMASVANVVAAAAHFSSPLPSPPPLGGTSQWTTPPSATATATKIPSEEAGGVTGQDGQPRGSGETEGGAVMSMAVMTVAPAQDAVAVDVMAMRMRRVVEMLTSGADAAIGLLFAKVTTATVRAMARILATAVTLTLVTVSMKGRLPTTTKGSTTEASSTKTAGA